MSSISSQDSIFSRFFPFFLIFFKAIHTFRTRSSASSQLVPRLAYNNNASDVDKVTLLTILPSSPILVCFRVPITFSLLTTINLAYYSTMQGEALLLHRVALQNLLN